MEISKEQLFEAVEGIFSSMLGLAVAGMDAPSDSADGVRVTSSVSLTGDWNGSILIECSGDLACQLAQALLMADCQQVDDDVKDVLGEITNMVAGNVSRQLSGFTQLSLPSVITGEKYTVDVLKGQTALRLPLSCKNRTLNVSVVRASAG